MPLVEVINAARFPFPRCRVGMPHITRSAWRSFMRPLFLVIVLLACFSAIFCCCYAPALSQDRQFGFRDAGHYYYPLHARVQKEWNEHRWPLWEAEENAGMPLIGNPTAAVLYPGKLVFALLPYAWAARIYIVAHTILAFAAMLALMRSWGISWAGSGLSALSYTFGAPILFQYCNVIYLVGAAWLPLGIHAVDGWVRLSRRIAILELAIVLGMQVLGGDPQSAFLLGVAGLGYAIGVHRARTISSLPDTPNDGNRLVGRPRSAMRLLATGVAVSIVWFVATVVLAIVLPKFRHHPVRPPIPPLPWMPWVPLAVTAVWLAVGGLIVRRWRGRVWKSPVGVMWLGMAAAALLASAITAAQLFPVIEFTQQTTRASEGGTHELYAFSVEPYRLVEAIWPDFWGGQFGENTYWSVAFRIPGVYPKIWVPSLYLGGLTFVLALSSLAFRKGPPWRAWLSVIILVSVLGSLGKYTSPVWLTRVLAESSGSALSKPLTAELGPIDKYDSTPIREDGFLRDGDGSIYWLLATFLPGFRQFRFPAKMFTFTALGMAALGGLGWDGLVERRARGAIRLSAILLGVTACVLLGAWAGRQPFRAMLGTIESGSMFGPFSVDGAFWAVVRCLVHALVVLGSGLLLILLARIRPTLSAALMLFVLTCDLAVSNARHVFTVPQALFEDKPEVLEHIEAEERARPAPGPFRVHRMALWNPPGWGRIPSSDRVSDFVAWERGTLQPKYGIDMGVEYTHTIGVAELYDYEWYFNPFPRKVDDPGLADRLNIKPHENIVYYPRRGFDLWNTRYFILPQFPNGWNDAMRANAAFLFNSRPVYPPPGHFTGKDPKSQYREWVETKDYRIERNVQELPRAWVVHDVRVVKPTEGLSGDTRRPMIEEILYANDVYWHDSAKVSFDPRQIAWAPSDVIAEINPGLSRRCATASEEVKVTYPSPQQAVLEVELESPGIVVLADVIYPGWALTIDDKPAKIYRVNGLMRGALVPAKRHKLVYTYAPLSFQVGLAVSGIGLVALLAIRPLLHQATHRSGPVGISTEQFRICRCVGHSTTDKGA